MPPAVNLSDLGHRARAARLARRMTLDDVVSRANFTVSWLSKLENGLLTPSLDGLVKLAEVLECGVDDLVAGLAVPPRYVAVKDGEGRVEPADRRRRNGVTVEHRADAWRDRAMHPVVLQISGPGTRHGPDCHQGERFLLVLDGSLKLEYGDDLLLLAKGDSVYLDAATAHTLMPATRGSTVRVLSVVHESPAGPRGARIPVRREGRRR
ncbi:MAG: XRE family transcriptional regulator [Planctomycetia bacterium]|nr:XRE family transcriptional regulator [Planctomycetia bacterium]